MSDALAIGDIIQPEGDTVPVDLRDKFFIVRQTDPETVLSWPYTDQQCTVLYVPFVADQMSQRDWHAQCASISRREMKANKALGLVLKSRPLRFGV